MGELTITGTSRTKLIARWQEGYKHVEWELENGPDLVPTLQDIVRTVEPNNTGPLFVQPGVAPDRERNMMAVRREINPGMEAAERAARDAEVALLNGGQAIGRELPIDGVPVYGDEELRALSVGPDWNPVNVEAFNALGNGD